MQNFILKINYFKREKQNCEITGILGHLIETASSSGTGAEGDNSRPQCKMFDYT